MKKCDIALEQLKRNQYEVDLKYEGYKNILKFGIAFKDKQCMVKRE